ncbi:aminotransferase class I/II-fold pyridoxal phosphate-dependent enzyme [Methanolobus sp. ZRKC3]|uniref:aminotransferase class I/II-fold pyridoxal phosphate-dependent enzyme n=1 Tax=Methanolobus sp. ZRKC3 TaxID=3125786 RepID=UPI0032430EF1
MSESDILDFSKSLNPLGNPFDHAQSNLEIGEVFDQVGSKLEQYPDNRYTELKAAAALFLDNGTKPENIIPGNGSCELLRLIMECLLYEGDEVIIPVPCPLEYVRICESFGAKIQRLWTEELFKLSTTALENAKAVFFSNPNNPTGKLTSRSDLLELISKCAEHQTLLIVDESFIELCDDPTQTITDFAINNDHLFVIRSVTNTFSIPGVRFSYGITSPAMSYVLNSARLSWNIGAVTEQIAVSVLGMDGGVNSRYLQDSRRSIRDEREYLMTQLSFLYGFKPIESNANYVLVDMNEHFMDSSKFYEGFAAHGIFIRDCRDFFEGDDRYIRLSIRPREEFDVFLHNIDEVYAQFSKEEAREKLEETIEHGGADSASSRENCDYYPCHFHGQDCTFCFCPFYPCDDERTGGKLIDSAAGGKVWSCEFCNLLHQAHNAKKVLEALMNEGDTDENVKKAWKIVIEPYLEDDSGSECID